jgi:hypothetical protein
MDSSRNFEINTSNRPCKMTKKISPHGADRVPHFARQRGFLSQKEATDRWTNLFSRTKRSKNWPPPASSSASRRAFFLFKEFRHNVLSHLAICTHRPAPAPHHARSRFRRSDSRGGAQEKPSVRCASRSVRRTLA